MRKFWQPMLPLLLAALVAPTISAFTTTSEPKVEVADASFPVGYSGPRSLEERILASPVIARVTLNSVSYTTEGGTTYLGMKHLATVEFNFSVLEYIKGTGADNITAVWVDSFYDTRQEVAVALLDIAAARDAQWDDREAILFLQHSAAHIPSTQRTGRFYLSGTHRVSGVLDDYYSLASRGNKLWLPADATPSASSQPTGDQQRFLMDVPPSTGTSATITLGELKTRVVAVAAKLAAGDGSEEYRKCVQRTYSNEGVNQYRISTGDEGLYSRTPDQELASGLPSSSTVFEKSSYGALPNLRGEVWFEGADADLFSVVYGDLVPHDFSGDGVIDSARYDYRIVSARPLPEGRYTTNYNNRAAFFVQCDGWANSHDWTITVTAPYGVLHEAFFDPVTDGTAVAADSANGVLKPRTFTAEDASATIERIAWDSGTVTLKVTPLTHVTWHAVDFIELDGTVSLSLNVSEATVDTANDTLIWSVASQPWESGDKLMLRIHGAVEPRDCSNGAAVPDPNANPGLVADCEALLAGRDTLAGTATLNWSADVPIEEWEGIVIGGSPRRVVEVRLDKKELGGSIPPEFGDLPELKRLQLSNLQLNGSIPPELGRLENLKALRLYKNRLSGSIPPEMGNLASLVTFSIPNNELTGAIPPELGNLTNLVALIAGDNQLSGPIPPQIGNVTDLVDLDLENNNLTGGIPLAIGNLAALFSLNLAENDLTGEIPPELGALSELQLLILYGNRLSGSIPPELGNLSNLAYLGVMKNELSGCVPFELQYGPVLDFDKDTLSLCPDPNASSACAIDGAVRNPSANPGLLSDCEALLAGRDTLAGTATLNWSADVPIEEWDGIVIGGSPRRVIEVRLDHAELDGSIPPELVSLTSLEVLWLQSNRLNGSIPPEIGSLPNLNAFVVYNNRLSGSIPPELGSLASLEMLWIDSNRLSGLIPSELGDLSSLRTLRIGGNELTGEIPLELSNLTNLLTLSIVDSQLSGPIPPELGDLTNLEELRLYGNQLSGPIPPELGNLEKLRWLRLEGNNLTGVIPLELGKLATLQSLNLAENDLTGEIPAVLGHLVELEEVRLFNNRLSGSIPPELGDLSNLEILYIEGNQLSGCVPFPLRDMPELRFDKDTLSICPDPSTIGPCAVDGAVQDPSANPGLVADCEALLTGRDTLAGTATLNWSADLPIVEWDGVTIGGTPQRVVALNLSRRELTGSIPRELSGLANLRELNLSFNQLNGEIPSELGNLSNLESLSLHANQLSGPIPIKLGRLSNLKELRLNTNRLSGEIPLELDRLSSLRILVLEHNRLSGSIPPELGKLGNLSQLSVGNNDLTGVVPAELGNFSNLEDMNLAGNRLIGSIPPELGNLSNLKTLYLGENELSGSIPSELGNLSNLQWLNLTLNELSGPIPDELGNLTNLQSLGLGANQLSGSIPVALGSLSKLEELYLSNNELSGSIPVALGGLSKLESLYLSNNELSGSIPVALGSLSNLQYLYLRGNGLSGPIPVALASLSKLEWLDLGYNQLGEEIPVELGNLTNLRRLFLHNNRLSGEIPKEFGNLNDLRILWLQNNELNGEILPELGGIAALDKLRLGGNQFSGCIPRQLGDLTEDDLHFVDLPFCAPERLPATGGHVPPNMALLLLTMVIGSTVGMSGVWYALNAQRRMPAL